jgi:hypothetical protein
MNGTLKNGVTPNRALAPVEPSYVRLAREYLGARGVTLEQFEAAGGEVVPNARAVNPVYPAAPALVFYFSDPRTGEPMTFTDERGHVRRFQRVRPLGPRPLDAPKFLQPRNSGTRVYFARHPAVDWATELSDPTRSLIVTEGETRSLAGAVRDPELPLPVISITGVDCGQIDGKLHPDLAGIPWQGRQVFLAFDSDVARKPDARHGIDKLIALLTSEGAQVFETALPHTAEGGKQGLDDLLAAHGARAFVALVQSPETRTVKGVGAFSPPVSLTELLTTPYPPTEWIWNPFVLKGEVNLLFGDGGTGKSLLALHLALAAAAGKPLFGEATMRTPVLALFAEDGPGQVQQRARTILRDGRVGAIIPDLPVRFWCQPSGDVLLAQIADDGTVTELPRLRALRAELESCGRPALVILDSLADLFAMNESLRLPVNAALKQVLGGLCRDYGATVLVLAHPSKASMQDGSHYSGSTAFNNSVRQRLTLEIVEREASDPIDGAPPRVLSVAKSNYGAHGEKRLWYCGTTIMDAPPPQSADGLGAAFHRACVEGALEAARKNMPCNKKHINEGVFRHVGKVLGRRPSPKDITKELELAVQAGELRFVEGEKRRAGGFYPPDENEAIALAVATKNAIARAEE